METTYGVRTQVGATRRSWAFSILALVLLLNVLIGAGLWYVAGSLNTWSVLRDLDMKFAAVQSLPDAAALMNPRSAQAFRVQLAGIQADVHKLSRNALFIGGAQSSTAVQRALQLTSDLCLVGQDVTNLVRAFGPGMQLLLQSMVRTPAVGGRALGPAFTASDIAAANAAFSQLRIDWSRAFHDRQRLTAYDVQVLPVAALSALIHAYDNIEPPVESLITISSAAMADVSTVLGLTRPANYLLLTTDSNDLRAAGGFITSYALLTVSGGRLTSSVALKSVHALDCPNNVCPVSPVPAGYSWFTPATDAYGNPHFGLQDANLDPSLPTSAQLIETQFQRDTRISVDGVILITPAVLAQLLSVTGPVTLPGLHETITADTVQAQLGSDHQAATSKPNGASTLAMVDAALANALIAKLGPINNHQLDAIAAHLANDIYTKDVQLYFNDPALETVLESTHLAGEVRAEPDSLMIVDTSDADSYTYAQVTETQHDDVQLDVQGGAQHSLSIQYDYVSDAQQSPASPDFGDLVRVIVPQTARSFHITGPCMPTTAAEAGFSVLACRLTLKPGESTILQFSWYVHDASTPPKPPFGYALLVQRQAGSTGQLEIEIVAPNGHTLSPGNDTRYVQDSLSAKDFTMRTTVR